MYINTITCGVFSRFEVPIAFLCCAYKIPYETLK